MKESDLPAGVFCIWQKRFTSVNSRTMSINNVCFGHCYDFNLKACLKTKERNTAKAVKRNSWITFSSNKRLNQSDV